MGSRRSDTIVRIARILADRSASDLAGFRTRRTEIAATIASMGERRRDAMFDGSIETPREWIVFRAQSEGPHLRLSRAVAELRAADRRLADGESHALDRAARDFGRWSVLAKLTGSEIPGRR